MCIATHLAAARLACVRRAASVQSEPGSNSPLLFNLLALPQPQTTSFIPGRFLQKILSHNAHIQQVCSACSKAFSAEILSALKLVLLSKDLCVQDQGDPHLAI